MSKPSDLVQGTLDIPRLNLIAAVASWAPASRAASLDANTALREE